MTCWRRCALWLAASERGHSHLIVRSSWLWAFYVLFQNARLFLKCSTGFSDRGLMPEVTASSKVLTAFCTSGIERMKTAPCRIASEGNKVQEAPPAVRDQVLKSRSRMRQSQAADASWHASCGLLACCTLNSPARLAVPPALPGGFLALRGAVPARACAAMSAQHKIELFPTS